MLIGGIQELIDKQPKVELDANVAKLQDTTEAHPQPKEFEVLVDSQKVLQEQNLCLVGSKKSREVYFEACYFHLNQ